MSERVCIIDADAPMSRLRYHRIGGWWAARGDENALGGLQSACGRDVGALWGINSIRRERAEAMGATPCRRCFPAVAE